MNIDLILETFNRHQAQYLLLGGMNFLLRHEAVTTFDIDFWIEDSPENRRHVGFALAELGCEWGTSDSDWTRVADLSPDWLATQSVYCLHSPHGAIDIFRVVLGLATWEDAYKNSLLEKTASGTPYRGICDQDMLRCQQALAPGLQRLDRIRVLERVLEQREET